MSNHVRTLKKFNIHMNITDRIELVMVAQLTHGHINRKILMQEYGITQIQAGALIRDFIKAHSVHIEWSPELKHYTYSKTPKPVI